MPNPAFVQGNQAVGGGTAVSSAAVSLTSVAAGDTLLLFVSVFKGGSAPVISSVADTLGNTYQVVSTIKPVLNNTNYAWIYAAFGSPSGSPTITVTWSTTIQDNILQVLEYSNAPIVAAYNGATGSSTALASGNVITPAANEMLIGFGTLRNTSAQTLSAGGGFTQRQSSTIANAWTAMTEDLLETSTGTFGAAFTASATGTWTCQVVGIGAALGTLIDGEVVLGTTGGSGSAIGTAGGGNDPNGNTTTKALVFDAGAQTQATPTLGGSWTQWYNPNASGDYVGIDCGAPIACDHVLMSFNNPSFLNKLMTGNTAQFQASNDVAFGTFTALFTFNVVTTFLPAVPQWGTLQNNIQFPLAGYYRYYRITLPAIASAPADLEFYGQFYSGVSGTCAPIAITNSNGTSGGYYDLPVNVRMSTPTTGAAIWYTTDGSTPSAGGGTSTLYSGPILISSNLVVQAIAILSGLSNSRVTGASYHIGSIVPTDRPFGVNRSGYRIWSNAGDRFHDPVSGLWYWYGMNSDQNGVLDQTGNGIDCYSSPDLRNWTFVSNCTNIAQSSAPWNRVSVVYNAANTNYVLWTQQALSANCSSYTSPNPGGPWTLAHSFTSMDGYSTEGDFKVFLDTNANCYLIICDNAGGSPDAINFYVVIHLLDSTYTTGSGTFQAYNNNTSGNTTPFGRQSEGFAFFKIGSTYYWASSNLSPFTPGINLYVTNTGGPLSTTWSAPVNPFQPDANELTDGAAGFWGPGPLTPSQNYAYDSQTDGFYVIPGRIGINPGTAALLYFGDRWDFQAFGVIQTHNDSYQGWRNIILPVAIDPNTGALTINWTNNWTFDSVFKQNANLPLAASSVVVTPGASYTITWVNNETGPYALYLDRATNVYFTQGVVSEVLASGTTSFVDSTVVGGQTYFYRVRTVNASGSVNQPLTPSQSGGVGTSLIGAYDFWGGGAS